MVPRWVSGRSLNCSIRRALCPGAVEGATKKEEVGGQPPDLAIEVDITSSSLDRMAIYASLGIPEVWRCDGETLTIHLLQANQKYAPTERSRALPRSAARRGDAVLGVER
jgi:hypothetical protein